ARALRRGGARGARGGRRGGCRRRDGGGGRRGRGGLVALGDESVEVVGEEPGELVGRTGAPGGGAALGAGAVEERREARLAAGAGPLAFEQRRQPRGEPVLLLEARHHGAGRDPTVRLAVDAHEPVSLAQEGPVDLGGR